MTPTLCPYCGEPLPANRRLGRHECPLDTWHFRDEKKPGMIVHGKGVLRQIESRAKRAWEKRR